MTYVKCWGRSTGSLGDSEESGEKGRRRSRYEAAFSDDAGICTDSGYVVIPGSAELFFIAGC